MADSTTNPLTCKQCGYANEGERVYCHNCGTKLDRSLLPTNTEPEETLAKKQKRIRKAVMPTRGFFAGAGKTFFFTAGMALLSAAVIIVAMKPLGVPTPIEGDALLDSRRISMEMEDAQQSNAPVKLTLTEADINSYLQNSIKAAGNGALGDNVKFVRAFVNIDEDRIRITAQQTVFGYPIYSTIYYKLSIKNNKLDAVVKGGSFGRLQIHPNLMKNLSSIFQKLWDALKRDKKALDQAQSVDVHKGYVEVVIQPQPMQ